MVGELMVSARREFHAVMMRCRKAVDRKNIHYVSKFEIECLLGLYKAACSKGKMDRNRFRDFLHREFSMTDDILMDRVFKAFDKDNDSLVGPSEWVEGLSILLRGNMEEKIQFCFDVYDLNSDGYISREEMFHMLKTSLVKPTSDEDPDEGIKDLVEVCIKKMDDDQDHRLSFKDFHAAVLREPLLIECFGPCLPADKDVKGFLEKLSVNSK
ncbi:hypothetical protein CAPTEDRAFT_207746 [Capitella teleta]|uniref:EF-hand domain-containing protein n=1 Tax=Capitella teleta TaxID=283909 RepID=R7V822_CAPTE|nr:hypothetical protein CAPTEDRAFT_207746 [Capitella teleta]|eukprot:ELU15013.1 hypothetical protein CAPTEDRAFT_207746 [Capitella teleta]